MVLWQSCAEASYQAFMGRTGMPVAVESPDGNAATH